MTSRLTLAIHQHLPSLSPSERKLANLLLERADDLLTYSATEMASMAGVSKATAARLFRSLGYADFNEVRLQARQERNLAQPFTQPSAAGQSADSREHTIAAHLQTTSEALTRTFEALGTDTLRAAASLIAAAPRVWLFGVGPDEGLVRIARPQLARARPNVHLLGTQNGIWAEDLAMTAPKDVLLLVATQPRTKIVDRLLEHAATTRVGTVAVVDLRNANWARRHCQVVLPCYGAGFTEPDATVTAASMLQLLTRNVAVKLGARAKQRLQVVTELAREVQGEP